MGQDSSVGIAIRYGLDGPRIESRWERDFLQQSRQALRPTQPPMQGVPDFPVRCPPIPSSSEVTERVELYTSTALCAFVACSRVRFTFTLL